MADRRQLTYGELLSRNGGPWAWQEPGNTRDKALPRHALMCILDHCDVEHVAASEQACFQWRELMISPDGLGVWQTTVLRALGRDRVEKYKAALGLRSGQSYEQERVDLTARNWKRILRMHKATKMLPYYEQPPNHLPLPGHSGPVLCMCLGGPYLFTGGADHVLFMYRVPLLVHYTKEKAAGKPAPRPSRSFGQGGLAHSGPVLCVAAEKEFLVSGGVDGLVKMWKVESAPDSPASRVLQGHQGPVWSICAMINNFCCSGGADKKLLLWDLNAPKGAKAVCTMTGHSAGVSAMCYSQKNDQVISASEDKSIRIWDPHKAVCISVLDGHKSIIYGLECWQGVTNDVSYDLVFSGDADGNIMLWDRPSGMFLSKVEDVHADAIKGMSLSLDPQQSLLTASMDGTVRLWKPDSMECERVLVGEDGSNVDAGLTMAVAWANIVVSSSWDGVLRSYVYTE
mmetsp:Transcript_33422/g.84444  ORF Transcript_33422/g.84444 Transcript_33422/m.84444 type:complete len:456 (-) Transcript_33422:28-1395(-)